MKPSEPDGFDIWDYFSLPLVMLFMSLPFVGFLFVYVNDEPIYLAPSNKQITWIEKSDLDIDCVIGPASSSHNGSGYSQYGNWIAKHSQNVLEKESLLSKIEWKKPHFFNRPVTELKLSHIDSRWLKQWSAPSASLANPTLIMTWTYEGSLADDASAAGDFRQKSVVDWNIPSGTGFLFTSDGSIVGKVTSDESTVELFGPAVGKSASDRRIWAVLQINDLSAFTPDLSNDTIRIPLPAVRLMRTDEALSVCNTQCKFGVAALSVATVIGLILSLFILIGVYQAISKLSFVQGVFYRLKSLFVRINSFTKPRDPIKTFVYTAFLMLGFITVVAAASSVYFPRDLPHLNFAYTTEKSHLSLDDSPPVLVTLEQAATRMPCMQKVGHNFRYVVWSDGFAELDDMDVNCLSNWSMEQSASQFSQKTDNLTETAFSKESPKVVLAGIRLNGETIEKIQKSQNRLKVGGGKMGYSSLMCLAGRCFGYIGKADMKGTLWPPPPIFPDLPDTIKLLDPEKFPTLWLLHDLTWKTTASQELAAKNYEERALRDDPELAGFELTWQGVIDRLPEIYIARDIFQPQRQPEFNMYFPAALVLLLLVVIGTIVFVRTVRRRYELDPSSTTAANREGNLGETA